MWVWKSTSRVFLSDFTLSVLAQALSLSLELTDLGRLVGSQAPGLHLCGVTDMTLHLAFRVCWGSELGLLCLDRNT